ncbi:MAG: agmatine deiminase family protein [Hahellaceae bacterium]|nr:agmatine deiminase family protein [Hahellaceae bacterium]
MSQTNTRFLPAEWATQSAVMLTWPHAQTDWADILDEVAPVYFTIAREVLKRQPLLISCADEQLLESILVQIESWDSNQFPVLSYVVDSNDTWARDHGPITVLQNGQPVLLDFHFNAWGNKFPYAKDDLINQQLQRAGAFGKTPFQQINLVLEGGSIESNGQGVLLTTSQCLLTDTRNPGLSQSDVEIRLKDEFGLSEILWLNHGYLAGDDTDSHIDTLARFCQDDLICYVGCDDTQDEHYQALKNMESELKAFRQPNGKPYRLAKLPMTTPIYDGEDRLPSTYANFLIINGAVLVPVYDVAEDQEALDVLKECFPQHDIVPVYCTPLVKQHGSLHCITMQIPAGVVKS